jgi:hypothetical protein
MKSLFSRATAAVGLCAVSFGVLAPATEARVSGPRFDSLSIFCGQLQDEADSLLREYPNASPSRKDEILTRLRQIGETWYGTRWWRPATGQATGRAADAAGHARPAPLRILPAAPRSRTASGRAEPRS